MRVGRKRGLGVGLVGVSLVLSAPGECESPLGVTIHEPGTMDGYTLIDNTLIDMQGREVRHWEGVSTEPTKLLSNGHILAGQGIVSTVYLDWEAVEIVENDWDNQTLWRFSDWDPWETDEAMARQHHDFQREGVSAGYFAPGQAHIEGGTTLVLAHQNYRVPSIMDVELLDDVLYEVRHDGTRTDFEWHAADHVEEFGFSESALQALGEVTLEEDDNDYFDWLHINSVSYLGENRWYDAGDSRFHPENLIIGSRSASFIAIIEKESGEVVWRVGPDFGDDAPEGALGQICGQHHPHMIPEGLPGAGNILVFDNGFNSGYGDQQCHRGTSRVLEFDPITLEVVWEYGHGPSDAPFYSAIEGSAQRLLNGNTLITPSFELRTFEVTVQKEVVWEFRGMHGYRGLRIPPDWLPEGTNPGGYEGWE